MRIALTGVPGSGKTTLAASLRGRCAVLHLNDLAREAGLLSAKDEARGAYLVDMDDLADVVNARLEGVRGTVIIEGHFAHEMDVDRVVLLRCDPAILIERLRARGYPEEKVRENVEAEALDVLAQEVLDTGIPAVEIDVSKLSVDAAADAVWAIAEMPPKALKGEAVGSAAWSLEALPWS